MFSIHILVYISLYPVEGTCSCGVYNNANVGVFMSLSLVRSFLRSFVCWWANTCWRKALSRIECDVCCDIDDYNDNTHAFVVNMSCPWSKLCSRGSVVTNAHGQNIAHSHMFAALPVPTGKMYSTPDFKSLLKNGYHRMLIMAYAYIMHIILFAARIINIDRKTLDNVLYVCVWDVLWRRISRDMLFLPR